jgi:hypothetical protein
MKTAAIVTTFIDNSRQPLCLSSTGTVTQGGYPSLLDAGDVKSVPRSDRRIKVANIFCSPCRTKTRTTSAPSRPLISSRQTSSAKPENSRRLIVGDGNVICFRPRGTTQRELDLESCQMTGGSPVEDILRYDGPESDHDLRYRTLINYLATIVIILVIVSGSWMVDTIISSWPR